MPIDDPATDVGAALVRFADWDARLEDYLAQCMTKRFEWGAFDCMLFAAGGVEALTGHDPAEGHRGAYSTELGATRHLKRHNYASPADMLDSLFPRVPVAMAQRGDLIEADGNIGICRGGHAVLVGDADDGAFVTIPLSGWTAAWKIG